LIEQQLIVQEAQKEGVAPTEAELAAAMADLRSRPAFQEELRQTGLSEDQVLHLFIEPSLDRTRLLAKMAKVTDAQVKAYFDQHKAELREPETAVCRVLQISDKKKAEEAEKLVGKTAFETIVQTFGGGPTAGRIEQITRQGPSIYPPQVVDAAFKTPKGQASAIIEAKPQTPVLQQQPSTAAVQYYIVYVIDKMPARDASLSNPLIKDRVYQAVIRDNSANLSPTAVQDLIPRLRRSAQINVVRPSVKSVQEAPPPAPTVPGMVPPSGP
jgi:parvulin-like peptidyl-prolyl isomerase